MPDLHDRLHRDLDALTPAPPPLDEIAGRASRRARHRRLRAGAVGSIVAVAVIAGAWAVASRNEDAAPPTRPGTPPAVDRVFLAGDGEAWVVDPVAETARHLEMPELPPGDAPHRVVRRDDALVAWAYDTLLLHPGDDPTSEVLVPDSLFFIPSSMADRVWVAFADDDGDARLDAVREVAVDGTETVPDVLPPGGAWPIAAVGRSLVFQEEGSLIVWDPATRTEVDRLPGELPLAWAGDRLAWCDDRCERLHVTDVAAGTTTTIEPPAGAAGFEALQGAFSPDGTTLAVALRLGEGRDADRQLALVDVPIGSIDDVDGATVPTPYVFVDWDPSGDTVYLAGGQQGGRRSLVAYRPGDPAASVVDVAVGDFYGMAAYEVASAT
jgi:hypothetical protein